MGGISSGRRTSFRNKTDDLRSIDLTDLRRWGSLTVGRHGSLTWSYGDETTARINYQAAEHALILNYRYKLNGDDWESIRDIIHFDWTGQHLGGKRCWFLCPTCERRCRVIYGGTYFRCRKCHGLVYSSQYEPFPVGNLNQLDKIRQRLGGSIGLSNPFPPKPKGMHRKTYKRLREADWEGLMRLEGMLDIY